MIKRVLITGGTGYIGSHIARKLLKEGYEVATIIRSTSSKRLIEDILDKLKLYEYRGDINELEKIYEEVEPEVVIHVAAQSINEVKPSEIKTLIESNVVFGTQVLAIAAQNKIKYFINTGSYWQNFSHNEYNPVNLYAATKQAFEVISKFYVEMTDLRMITLRLSDTYGPNDPRKKLIPLLIEASRDHTLLAMSPGEQELNPVYIDDVVNGYLRAIDRVQRLEKHQQAIYQVSTDEIYTLKQVVKIFEQISKKTLKIAWGKRAYMPRTIMKVHLDYPSILENTEITILAEGLKKVIYE